MVANWAMARIIPSVSSPCRERSMPTALNDASLKWNGALPSRLSDSGTTKNP